MSVRYCSEIGDILKKIYLRLSSNDTLVNLLYYADKDPLSQPALTNDQKKEFIFNKLIRFIPKVLPIENEENVIGIRVEKGIVNSENDQFQTVIITLETFCPLTQWFIKNENLRPFLIMGEIEKSLRGKTISGLGKIEGGDFDLDFISDEVCAYIQTFVITTYD